MLRDALSVNPQVLLHAVVRHDAYVSDIANAITIVAVVPTKAEALEEVDRLNDLKADTPSYYFWSPAKVYLEGVGPDSTCRRLGVGSSRARFGVRPAPFPG